MLNAAGRPLIGHIEKAQRPACGEPAIGDFLDFLQLAGPAVDQVTEQDDQAGAEGEKGAQRLQQPEARLQADAITEGLGDGVELKVEQHGIEDVATEEDQH